MQVLYELQRSALVGSRDSNEDNQSLSQDLFLNAAPSVALRLLSPELHLLERGSGQFNTVLPANIALWSGISALSML